MAGKSVPVPKRNVPAQRALGAGSKPRFPLRAAAVDVGSNAIRLLVAEFKDPHSYRVLENVRASVRLGHGVFLTGKLSPEVTREAIRTLAAFKKRMEELRVVACHAVATSAVRESANGEEFLKRVWREARLYLETINGSEEARLIHRAVKERVEMGTGRWLLADLGGGSVEVSVADASGVIWTESHTMGAVRLLEELAGSADDPGRLQRLLTEYVDTLRISSAITKEPLMGCIATGGNIETLAQMGPLRPGPERVARLPLRSLDKLIGQLACLSYRERVEGLGLREDRADVIFPAAMIYAKLARFAKAEEILVPFVGVKEGVLLDLVDGLAEGRDQRDREERQVELAALALGRKYHFDEAHGRHVARLSLSLFDQLATVHKLGARDRRALHAAALLHDIGSYVSYSGHHKHSHYLISHSNLAGFGQREMEVVANVARYHRRSAPKAEHEAYAVLDRKEKAAVLKLSSLMRLADAMDRERRQKVYSVKAEVKDGLLKLRLEGQGDLLLEGWSLKKKADLLLRAFGLGLEVTSREREET